MLRRLADIRAAVIGEVCNATGMEAVRGALLRLYDGFTLRRVPADAAHHDRELYGDYDLEPHPRADIAAGFAFEAVPHEPVALALTMMRWACPLRICRLPFRSIL